MIKQMERADFIREQAIYDALEAGKKTAMNWNP